MSKHKICNLLVVTLNSKKSITTLFSFLLWYALYYLIKKSSHLQSMQRYIYTKQIAHSHKILDTKQNRTPLQQHYQLKNICREGAGEEMDLLKKRYKGKKQIWASALLSAGPLPRLSCPSWGLKVRGKENWGETGEHKGKLGKIEQMFLSCPLGSNKIWLV